MFDKLADRSAIKPAFQIFDAFLPFQRNKTECNSEISVKVKLKELT